MKPHTLDSACSQRYQAPFVLQASEGALDGRPATVEALPTQRFPWDQGMQPVGLDPLGLCGTFACRTTPLRSTALVVGSCEAPCAVLAARSRILSTLYVGSLSQGNHRRDISLRTLCIDSVVVVSLIKSACLRINPKCVQLIEQRCDCQCFMLTCCLDSPRKRQVCGGTYSHVQPIAVESAALACGDSRAVPPRSVRVGVRLTFRSILGLEALPIGIGGHIGGVDRHIPSKHRIGLLQCADHVGDAPLKDGRVLAQLRCEAVARPMRRNLPTWRDQGHQRCVLFDERHGARPCGDRVHGLRQRHADQGSKRIARTACRTSRLKPFYKPANLGRFKDACKGSSDGSPCYVWRGHGELTSWVQTPGCYQQRGGQLSCRTTDLTGPIGRENRPVDCCSCVPLYVDMPDQGLSACSV
jgi:hypothetical protein